MAEHHDHQDPKPTNKWIATPILAAVVVIGLVVGIITLSTGQCCGGKCESKAGTEQGAGHHGETDGGHETTTGDEANTDSTAAVADSTAEAPVEESHDAHGH